MYSFFYYTEHKINHYPDGVASLRSVGSPLGAGEGSSHVHGLVWE